MPDLVAQLLLYLFDGKPHRLTAPVEQWLAASKRYSAFVEANRDKIRKKIRVCRTGEQVADLYCELRTASLLLQEPKFAVSYEPRAREKGRSPDFAVRFTTQMIFHVEVTRLRMPAQESQVEPVVDTAASRRHNESRRLADVVCDKCAQLAHDTPNVLWIVSDSKILQELELEQELLALKRRAEQRDPSLLARYGFTRPADFLRYYQRLSAIVLQSIAAHGAEESARWWQNADGRLPLPTKAVTRLRALLVLGSR